MKKPALSLCGLILISPIYGQDINLFLFGGQSNMVGRGQASNTSSANLSNLGPQPDVNFNYRTTSRASILAGNPWGNTSNGWTTLDVGGGSSNQTFGIELSAAQTMTNGGLQNLAFTKYAVGATTLFRDWEKGFTLGLDLYDGNSSYIGFVDYVNNTVITLEDSTGMNVNLCGMFWMQGESDAVPASGEYGANLSAFVSNLRTDLGAPNLAFVMAPLNEEATFTTDPLNWQANAISLNAQIAAVAVTDPLIAIGSSTNGLSLIDAVHYDGDSLITIGEDLSQIMLPLVGNHVPEPSSAVLVMIAGFQFSLIRRKVCDR